MNNLAVMYGTVGKLDLALPLYEKTLNIYRNKFGLKDVRTAMSMNNLAVAYMKTKKLDAALPLLEEAMKIRKEMLSTAHPDTMQTMYNLARVYWYTGKPDQSLPLHEEAFRLQKANLGLDHPDTQNTMESLAGLYSETGKQDVALPLYEETFKHRKTRLGPDHPDTLSLMGKLTWAYTVSRRFERAIHLYEQLWEAQKRRLPEGDITRIDTQNLFGLTLLLAGRLPEAEEHLLASYRLCSSSKDFPSEWQQAYALRLVCLYTELRRPAEVAQWQVELMKLGGATEGRRVNTGRQMLQASQFQAAELLLCEALAIREQKEPDAWTTFNTHSMLGGALLGQKKYAEAEPLLLKGYEGMKQREKTIPPQGSTRLLEALDRLIQLYSETNKPDEVKKWQAKKGKLPKAVEKKN